MRSCAAFLLLIPWLWGQNDEALTRMAMERLNARASEVKSLDRAGLERRREQVRKLMLAEIGGLPADRTPLNARVTGRFDRKGYHVENVVYESLPGFRVTANLYVPDGPGPFPALLGVAGHSANGKAYPVYQHAWIGFARRGYVVLAFDPPGQGERQEAYDPDLGRSKVGVGVAEHILAGMQCLLTGSNVARYEIWDGIRGVDYLLTRKEVDSKRIAVAGNSGGGTQTAYLAVFEPRIAAFVSSCYMTGWSELWRSPGPQDAEQLFAGFLRDGLDFGDFALAASPRPFMMTTAIRDFFPIAGARSTFQEIERTYELLGVSEHAGYFEYDDPHGWSQPRREAAYRFLDRWLRNEKTDGAEPEIEPELETRLWVTPTGQVSTSFGSETVQTLNARYARELAVKRRPVTRATIARRLGIEWNPIAATGPANAILTMGLSGADVKNLEQTGKRVQALPVKAQSGGPLVLGDYSPAYQLAARAWLLGSSTAAAQVQEVLNAVRGINGPVMLVARGAYGPIALMAAALEPAILRLGIDGSILSYQDVVEARIHMGLESLIIPGILQDFDLPDLFSLIAPRKVLMLSPVRPNGSRIHPLPVVAGAEVREKSDHMPASRLYQHLMVD